MIEYIKQAIKKYKDINCPYLTQKIIDNPPRDWRFSKNEFAKQLTLKEYIDIMKEHKELHIFRHDVHIDHNSFNYILLYVNLYSLNLCKLKQIKIS